MGFETCDKNVTVLQDHDTVVTVQQTCDKLLQFTYTVTVTVFT
jgi:methyl coenzyme M reductase subunit D